MRITFVLPTVSLSGGIRVIAIYARALSLRGHDVLLVSPPPPALALRRKLKSLLTGNGWPNNSPSPRSHIDDTIELKHRVLDRWRPITNDDVPNADVVIATWWETAEWVYALAPEKGAKVYFIQGYEIFHDQPISRVHETYKLPMKKIVIAQWLKEIMRKKYGDNSVDLVPNSVDRTQFFSDVRGKQAIPTIGFLYATSSIKGLDVALAAIEIVQKHIQNLRVITFGSESPTATAPPPNGAEFSLTPSQNMIRNLYSQCDVWISASHSEGFNLPAMEAMACRTPVVSTRTGWPEEAIKTGENGVLVDIDDAEGLARGIFQVLQLNDTMWRSMSLRAYETVLNSNSWETSAQQFEAALKHANQRTRNGKSSNMPPQLRISIPNND